MVAARRDALGSRLNAFVSTIYLAKKTGLKFGFIWLSNDNDKSGWSIEKPENLFEDDFVKEHCYNENIPFKYDHTMRSLKELRDNPLTQNWGTYISNSYTLNKNHISDLDEEEYKREFQDIFYTLPFKKPYKEAREFAWQKAEELGNFIAIHMRSGDAITTLFHRSAIFYKMVNRYVFPVDLVIFTAKHFIEQGFKVVLFSADKEASFAIKEHLKDKVLSGKFFLALDFIKNFNAMQAQIFDMNLMAKASKILAAEHSWFSKFASFVGANERCDFNTYFSTKELYNAFIIPHIKDYADISNTQKAVSCAYAYVLALKLNAPFAERIKLLNLALEFDTNNSAYRIMMLDEFFKKGYFARAEQYLKNVANERCEEFLKSLFMIIPWFSSKCAYEPYFKHYEDNANENYPYISFVAAKIAEFHKDFKKARKFINLSLNKEPENELFLECARILTLKMSAKFDLNYLNSAKARIHNHLAYKLGATMIRNSKSLLGVLRMPFILSALAISHKEGLKSLKQIHLPPLETYSDYKNGLKEKECFTYKLGLAFIKANKTWFKGGYFAFFFKDLPKLVKEFKDKKTKV